MDRLLRITTLQVCEECSPSLKKRAAETVKLVEALRQDWQKFTEAVEAFKAGHPDQMDVDNAEVHQRNGYEFCFQALARLRELQKIDLEHQAELPRLIDRAHKEHEAAKIDIRRRLMEFGYHAHNPDEGLVSVCSLTPEMIHRHPEVFAARERLSELERRMGSDFAQLNGQEIAAVEKHLQEFRNRLCAV